MLRIIAYLCIWTTPIQVTLFLWGVYIVAVSDYSLYSLTNFEFITNQLSFLLPVIDWMYTWISKPLLDWVLSIPIVLHQSVKAVASTWFGIWLLRNLDKKYISNGYMWDIYPYYYPQAGTNILAGITLKF